MLTTSQKSELRKSIISQISAIETIEQLAENSSKVVNLDQANMGRVSRIDAISQQQMAQANLQRDRERKRQLQMLLERLDSEDFGDCQECGEGIAFARLLVKPESQLCIDCQTQLESHL